MGQNKHLLVLRAIIEDKEGRILLVKRAADRAYNPGKWELPGGKVLPGSTVRDALDRVVNEEIGLIINDGLKRHYVLDKLVTEGKYKGFTYVEIAIPATHVGGKPEVGGGDLVASEWARKDQIFEYDLSFESKTHLAKYLADEKDKRTKTADIVLVSRALLENEDGEFLLIKRAPGQRYPQKWEVPGGKLDSFESLEMNLVREVLEETGVLIDKINSNIYSHIMIEKSGDYKGVTFVNILNHALAKTTDVRLDADHTEYKWVPGEELLDMDLAEYMRMQLAEALYILRQRK